MVPKHPPPSQAQQEIEALESRLRELRGDGIASRLEQSEAKFRALTETAASAIFIIQDGRFVYMNPAGQKLGGYGMDELGAMDSLAIVHPEHRELTGRYARDLLEGRQVPAHYQIRILAKDGRELWAELTAAHFEHQGRPAIIGTATDITEHKQAQESLQESQKRLADIINFLPDPTFAINRAGQVIVWNRAVEELTGIAAEDIVGKGDYEYALPFWGERRPILADLAMEWDQSYEDRYPFVSRQGHTLLTEAFAPGIPPDGAYLWGKASALFDSQGQVAGAIETVRDITTRRDMEEALRESAAHHLALVNSLPVGVISVDPDFHITEINPQGLAILGYGPEEVLGLPCGEVLRSEACHGTCPIRQSLLSRLPTGPVDTSFVSKHGVRKAVRLSASGLYNAAGELVGGVEVFQDVSQLKALERERANLVSMFAHDMKTPLVGIQGFALRLIKRGEQTEPAKQRQYLEVIRRQAEQLEKIINDFLDFARLETGRLKLNFSAVDLEKEVTELMEDFSPRYAQKGLELVLTSGEKLPVIEADPVHLRRALGNLLDNALKYSDQGGTVSIEFQDEGPKVTLRVRDQGAGIPPADLPYIFDMFYRSESQGKKAGHGLGLAGVEAIARGHGGRVLVTSEPGKGSVFSVELPKQQPLEQE
ncbi:MAG: PAS domain S-box protein [Desulfarculaceae bacterium]|nr:PAS domain S-box protein [Desulfarculaceae bacterium]